MSSTLTPAAPFFTPPTRTIRLSRDIGSKVRESLSLSADASVEDIAQKLDDLGKDLKAKEDGATITTVKRGAPLSVPRAVRAKAKFMRAAPRGRASTGPR